MKYELEVPNSKVEVDPTTFWVNLAAREAMWLGGVWLASRVLGWKFGKTYLAANALGLIIHTDKLFIKI